MRVEVDQDLCISCGLCVNECPEVFEWNDAGKAEEKAKEVPEDQQSAADESVEGCPTDAIKKL
ncbi:ferredoxin [Natranaerobius trueperi]|uniref:Ferredoxin n=1 Tax=Natranaerobius trueperi TaxID=759412 RepID=A0A226C2N6_9FIRM|nr:ferredoxin [Natranaerobius trueperi]OWZ84709.1 ferredoxin [Natranaerobius trueperi]